MPYGMGDLIGSLASGGLNQDIASQITPNANPLAQQGGGDGASQQTQQGLARPAVTQQDPVSTNLAALLLRKSDMARAAEGFNRGTAEMASAFGTAQQQASKKAALGGGGGGANPLGDVGDIMKIQDAVTTQNEHARFMANAGVLGQALRDHGINVTDAQTTELMNSPQFMGTISSAFGGNVTQTNTVKDADEATKAWAAANPNATEQQKAAYKANIIAMGSGFNMEDQAYRAYAQGEIAAGHQPDDIITWKNKHTTELKEQDATALNIVNAKKVLPGVNTTISNMTGIADGILGQEDLLKGIFADKNKVRWANAIMKADPKSNVALNAQQTGGLTADEVGLIQNASQLHNMNYRGAFSGEGNVKGIRSQVEAERVSRAADQLGNFTDFDSYKKNLNILKGTYGSAQANAAGEAQAYDQIPEKVRYRLDPSYFEGGANAPSVLPDWAKVKTVGSKADWDKLPNGQAYKAPGSPHGDKILIKGYEQQSLDDEANYGQ